MSSFSVTLGFVNTFRTVSGCFCRVAKIADTMTILPSLARRGRDCLMKSIVERKFVLMKV